MKKNLLEICKYCPFMESVVYDAGFPSCGKTSYIEYSCNVAAKEGRSTLDCEITYSFEVPKTCPLIREHEANGCQV